MFSLKSKQKQESSLLLTWIKMYHHTNIYEDITLACSVINVSSCIEKNFFIVLFFKDKTAQEGHGRCKYSVNE